MQNLFFFIFIYSLLPDAFMVCCFGQTKKKKKKKKKNRNSNFDVALWRTLRDYGHH